MITREQAAHLAQLARTIRPAWDELALIHLIGNHQTEPLQNICVALINAATNPRADTPRALEWSEHWPISPGDRVPAGGRQTCPRDAHSGVAHNCAQCRSEEIAPANPVKCANDGHQYYAHNCLDCRREKTRAMVPR